jgi:gp32 DNA binding protein like
MSFADLKKNRASAINKLTAAAEKVGGAGEKKSYEDNRFWAPTVDKAGNGYAVIRFLPACKGEDLPWIRYWDHGFKGPTGRWYIENSLTSIGQTDPVGELNSVLWNSGREEDKEIARAQKRRLHYVANILVVSDTANPSNDGKVFLYKFGKKIFDKIVDIMQPQFEDEKPINPFDFWEGVDFKLKIRNVEGYRNYDKSEFASPAPLFGGDESKLEDVYNNLYSLKEFTDPKNYKSYAELSKKLKEVLGDTGQSVATAEATDLEESAPAPRRDSVAASAPRSVSSPAAADSDDSNEDEGTLSYFAKLAKED